MQKGFTLIELLAVIVILAIIALIAVPIVLNIINDSKESALLRSAEFYLDAVEYTIADAFLYRGGLSDGEYPITPEGDICKDALVNNECSKENTLKVEVNGDKPTGGTITINSGNISDVSIILDEKTIVKDTDGTLIYQTSPCKLISGDKETPGSKYECEVKPGTKYNFYVLSNESDGTTNLIMDRNICEDGTPTEEGKTCLMDNDDMRANIKTILETYLNNATNSWSNIANLDLTYYWAEGETPSSTKIVINGKARPPYISEVVEADKYLFENLACEDHTPQGGPRFCVDGVAHISDIYGYLCANGYYYVSYDGNVSNTYESPGAYYGMRPVINVKL